MFKKNVVPQRKPFSITKEELMEDIERIHSNEDQRNKLYYCLDEKPPYDKRIKNIEDFLKGEVDLESASDNLRTVTAELDKLKEEIREKVSNIKVKSAEALKNT